MHKPDVWVGLDWGDAAHELCLWADGEDPVSLRVPHTAAGRAEMKARLGACGVVRGIAVETPRHLIVAELLDAGFVVYPVNPKMAKAWRDAWKVQPSKTDRIDAKVLADGLRHRHAHLRPLVPDARRLAAATPQKLVGFLKIHRLPLTAERQAMIDARRHVRGTPDAALFSSLPGAGPKIAPRLLAAFGADRERYDSADALNRLGGTVPVTSITGKRKPAVVFRRACRKQLRATLHQWAGCTLSRSAWARAFYDRARAGGQDHALALRNLAAKWLKILYRMWQDRRPYDEATYLNALIRHGSPLVDYMNQNREARSACG
jgi:transposase